MENLAADKDGIFRVVGSDAFLMQNIKVLLEQNIKPEQIMLDKDDKKRAEFLPADLTV